MGSKKFPLPIKFWLSILCEQWKGRSVVRLFNDWWFLRNFCLNTLYALGKIFFHIILIIYLKIQSLKYRLDSKQSRNRQFSRNIMVVTSSCFSSLQNEYVLITWLFHQTNEETVDYNTRKGGNFRCHGVKPHLGTNIFSLKESARQNIKKRWKNIPGCR